MGVFVIYLVVIIVLDGYYLFGYFKYFNGLVEVNDVGQMGVSGWFVIGMFYVVVDIDIEVGQFVVFGDVDEVEVIGVNVDIIYWWQDESDFEFVGQISGVVEWFFIFEVVGQCLFVQLDFLVGVILW